MYVLTTVMREFVENDNPTLRLVVETVVYLLVVTFLSFSALMYLVSRQGAMRRFRDHERVPRGELARHFGSDYHKSLTVLIPSYMEEPDVVAKTVWSAALQEFPDLRIVLLIDDPPHPTDPEVRRKLEENRALPETVMAALDVPLQQVTAARQRALEEMSAHGGVRLIDVSVLARQYRAAAHWLEDMAQRHEIRSHIDEFFTNQVLWDLAQDLRQTVTALEIAVTQQQVPDRQTMTQLYDRLVRIFHVRIHAFERKQYYSLSHEANKAMNLNSYISLMGGRWLRQETVDGVVLIPARPGQNADLSFPDSEYLLTLDADSMLLRDYCIRLVYLLEEPENTRVAVAQTPYCSYRGARTRIERIAGATTDIQHILHQGLTFYDATFWVGANAVIRKAALADIVHSQTVGGFTIRTYIQDRTVIEDTESSIDMAANEWHLVNYPERLSYSATPPDFGSLVVQRRRWADGGLLILPKYLALLRSRRHARQPEKLSTASLRVNYMASIAWASVGLILLLVYPFDSRLLSLWVIAAAVPYFAAMSQDLKDNGYRRLDIFSIYGFNLVLLAVNVAGTVKSIEQGMTNRKIPFARTPKVSNRTAAPGWYIFVPYVIVIYSAVMGVHYWAIHYWGNAAFALFNAALAAFAILAYIGWWNSVVDFWLGVVGWFYVPIKKKPAAAAGAGAGQDWKAMLYLGDQEPTRGRSTRHGLRRRSSRF